MTHTMGESLVWLMDVFKSSKSKHFGIRSGFYLPKESGCVAHVHPQDVWIGPPSFQFLQRWYEEFDGWFPKSKYEK